MTDHLTDKIMERIETTNVTNIPRWRFLLMRSIFWISTILAVVLGSAAVGVLFFLGTDFHRHGFGEAPPSIGEFIPMIPFLWILVLGILILIANESVRHTRRGYRYSTRTAALLCLVVSIVGGTVLSSIGVGRELHEGLRDIPLYQSAVPDSRTLWDLPHRGRLAGTVSSVEDATHFSLIDFEGHTWHITLASTTQTLPDLEVNAAVRMRGMPEPDGYFTAVSIHSWEH